MDFSPNRRPGEEQSEFQPLLLISAVFKAVVFLVLIAVGLKLTFWAVNVVDELLHRPNEIAILKPLLSPQDAGERTFTFERTESSTTFRDHNTLSTILLVVLLLVMFGAVGRAIAALITGAVRVLVSIDLKRPPPPEKKDGER